jgi:hypothetical protein
MARARSASFAFCALVPGLLTACPLRSFEVDQNGMMGGSAGVGGGSGQSGGSPSVAGAGGSDGGFGGVSHPRTTDDHYVILQGEDLSVPVDRGLLANDSPLNLRVATSVNADAARPVAFNAELDIEGDGSFHFTPIARFFGQYRFSYTAMNAVRQTALGSVEIRVVPTDVDLDTIVDGVGGYVLYGPPGSALGAAVDSASDIDGDGLRDLVVGAPTAEDGAGAAFVVFGKQDLRAIDLVPLPRATKERRFAAIEAGASDALGVSVSGLGDWDDDGTPDLMLGASGGNGRAYVVSGSDVTGAVTLPTSRGYLLEGDSANVDVGRVVRRAGDVNGDGVPDALVSASNPNLDYGWMHVLFGSPERSGRATVTVAPGLHVRGAFPGDGFPMAAVGVGDVDGDGASDVLTSSDSSIVLLRGGIGYPSDVGQVSIDGARGGWSSQRALPGVAAVAALGDVNGDGVPDFGYCEGTSYCRVVFGPPTTLSSGWVISGFSRLARKVLLTGGGDVDGDQLADVLLSDERGAYLVYGKRSGFTELNLAQLGVEGYSIHPAKGGTITAISVLGDSNGDGLADLALTDASADAGAGRVYVLLGVAAR